MRLAQARILRPHRRLASALAFYAASFTGLTQNPGIDDGNWIVPADRTGFRLANGNAIGLENPGPTNGSSTGYDDSIWIRYGNWPANQEVIITIAKLSPHDFQEVECIVRGSINGRYYEYNLAQDNAYSTIVRAEGTGNDLDDYTELAQLGGIPGGVNNGDRIRLRIVGFTLTVHVDHGAGAGWELVGSHIDTDVTKNGPIASGAPGFGGFKNSNGSPDMADYAIAAVEMRGI